MLGKAKDKMLSTAARRLLEGKLKRYGEITAFAIESKERRMSLSILPAGEGKPIAISVDAYRTVPTDDGIAIRIEKVTADRLWVAHLLEDYAEGLEIPLSGAAAKLVDWLL